MDAYSFEHTLAVILASDFGQINLLHKTVIYLCSESLTVYIAIQNFHSTSVKNSRISKGRKFWLVLKKTPALELNHMLQGYMLLVSLIFWVSKIPITSLHHPQLSLKEIFLHSSGSQAFPFLSLPVHPESFAINLKFKINLKINVKFNFSPPTQPSFLIFSTKISDWPPHICSSTCSVLSLFFTPFLITLLFDLVQFQHFSSSSCLIVPVGTLGLHAVWPTLSVLCNRFGYFPAFLPRFISLFLNCPSPSSFWSSSHPSTFRSHLVYNMYSLPRCLPLLIFYLYIR